MRNGLAEGLIERYIELDPMRPGASEARLKNRHVKVWALVGYLPAVHGDVEQVAHDYDLPVEAVEAAVAYYERHTAVIDDRLAANG